MASRTSFDRSCRNASNRTCTTRKPNLSCAVPPMAQGNFDSGGLYKKNFFTIEKKLDLAKKTSLMHLNMQNIFSSYYYYFFYELLDVR